jgi:leucine-rich repeat protein SHOC2
MPNWMSYRGEGCSLSFHMPPVFHGLVLWVDNDYYVKIIIRNNSNGIRLFECTQWYYPPKNGWIRYISRSKMAMEDYCADDEFELYISSLPSFEPASIKECGVHLKSWQWEEMQ